MCEARPSAAELTHEQEARILEDHSTASGHRDERVSCAGNYYEQGVGDSVGPTSRDKALPRTTERSKRERVHR